MITKYCNVSHVTEELDRMTKLIDVLTNLKMFLSIHKFHELKRPTLAILRANRKKSYLKII